ncbi:DUF2147 domain-containing protein [Limnohabitans sp. Rim8]|uniref:DUF2147 domain-containing protein n=1 Tax=Limnohabitans sp. Rim8 TaxID=1100718 RepID=UPI0033067C22
MRHFSMALGAALFSLNTLAQMTPLGTWHTIDDETKKPKGEVRITLSPSGGLSGVVEKSLMPMPDVDPLCNLCTDDRKGKPKIGMEIIRGGQKVDGKDVWDGGKILDPENGKNYSARLTPIEGGKKMEMRGYMGTPLIGRSQIWIRVN